MNLASAGKRAGLFGAAAVTAAGMALGTSMTPMASHASAATTVPVDVITTGPLMWLAGQLGLDTFTIPYTVPVIGEADIVVTLDWTDSNSVSVYDAVNAVPFVGSSRVPGLLSLLSGATIRPVVLATGTGTTGAIEAYKALLASGAGSTPEGYTPLTPHSAPGTNSTNLPMILLRNLGTPNGGFNARFAEIFELFGQNPVSPEGAKSTSPHLEVAAMLANIGIAYDSFSDFPITANIFSIANSLLQGAIPSNLLSGIELKGDSEQTILGNLVGIINGEPSTSYSYIVPTDFALLEPLRLPARLINLALEQLGIDFRMPTLLADALTPITKILVNIGYTDVVTPEMIANDPDTYGDYQPYDRTFSEAAGTDGSAVNWLSENPLTPSEWRDVPRDLVQALIDGFLGIFSGGSTSTAAPAAALAPKAAAAEASVAAEQEAAAPAPVSNDEPSGAADASTTSAPAEAPASVVGSKNKLRTSSSAAPKASAGDKSSGGSSSRGVGGSKRAAQAASSSDAA